MYNREIDWNPFWLRNIHHQSFWNAADNRRQFFDWIARKLKFTQPSDWYKINCETLKENGGKGLLNLYGGSVIRVLQNVYSEVDWKVWLFENPTKGFWLVKENQRKYL